MSGRPQVTLPDFTVLFCAHCLEPMRETWPAGAGLAALGMFNAFLEDPRALIMTEQKVENVPAVMNRVRPVCEWLGRKKTREVIQLALDGKCYGHSGSPPAPDPKTPHP